MQPLGVEMRGAPSLFNNAVVKRDTEPVAWDRTLPGDLGLSASTPCTSGTCTQRIILDAGVRPLKHQVIFFQLDMRDQGPWYMDYAWTFPALDLGQITVQWDNDTRTAVLVGDPFGTVQDFVWNVAILDDQGVVAYTSPDTPGTTRQLVLPDQIFTEGRSYQLEATAHSLDKVPGMEAVRIHSARYPVQ